MQFGQPVIDGSSSISSGILIFQRLISEICVLTIMVRTMVTSYICR